MTSAYERSNAVRTDSGGGGGASRGKAQRHAALVYRVLLWYWTSMLWSIDTCQNKVSADQYHVTISRAQVYSSSRSRVFWSWPLTKCWFSIGSRAHVRLTCWKQGRIVRKPVNASPGLKFIRIITFSSIQMFFAALFWVYGDYKTQNRKSHSKQKTSPQSYKTQINILPFPGLAQSGTEQPGQGAMLLGWPKSIYYSRFWVEQMMCNLNLSGHNKLCIMYVIS